MSDFGEMNGDKYCCLEEGAIRFRAEEFWGFAKGNGWSLRVINELISGIVRRQADCENVSGVSYSDVVEILRNGDYYLILDEGNEEIVGSFYLKRLDGDGLHRLGGMVVSSSVGDKDCRKRILVAMLEKAIDTVCDDRSGVRSLILKTNCAYLSLLCANIPRFEKFVYNRNAESALAEVERYIKDSRHDTDYYDGATFWVFR